MAASKKPSPKLTAAKRNRMAPGTFAIPSQRAYPLDTPGRARNALTRVAQNGTPAEQAQVKRAVSKRYPSIAVAGKKPMAASKPRRTSK